ncbi:MAG: helicase-related protein [Kiritimatiellae bacterium]|nr:helicase-related protein [Kiritimatiellia bacterium]
MPRIFDNINETLLPALQETLGLCEHADFCVGYFNLRGWRQLHEHIEQWHGGDGHCCRLLVGMQQMPQDQLRQVMSPTASGEQIDQATAIALKKKLAQDFRDQLMVGIPTNADEQGLRRLAAQISAGKVVVKLFLRHPLHAKLYLLFRQDPLNPKIGYLGSSNLTMAGLSRQGELNVDVLDHDACDKLAKWFEDRWTDRFCVDISQELVEIINTSWARPEPPPPYHIYVKMAYHLSQEARAGLTEFRIPSDFGNKLFEFQKAAVKIAAHHLNKRGGVVIGDVVGLGKTLMATTLARIFEDDHGVETLIICPRNLVPMWEDYRQEYRLRAKVLSVTRVQRELPDLRRFRLVLIDESHNLRNREGQRYRAIAEYIAANDSRVILLSATPYNKTYLDLSNQLRLFIDDRKDIGIRPEKLLRELGETEFIRRHQCPVRSLAAFEKSEHADDWRDLMRLYLVRRTRSFIQENYAKLDPERGRNYLDFADGTRSYFPTRVPKTVKFNFGGAESARESGAGVPPASLIKAGQRPAPLDQYARLFADDVVEAVNQLTLPRYGLGNYQQLTPHKPPTPDEAKVLADLSRAGTRLKGFCRTNLFKRLESSGHSFILSLERHILRNFICLHAIENGLPLPIGTQDMGLLDASANDEDSELWDAAGDAEENGLVSGAGVPPASIDKAAGTAAPLLSEAAFRARAAEVYDSYANHFGRRFKWLKAGLFNADLAEDLRKDAKALMQVLENAGGWDSARDAKLQALLDLLTRQHPTEKVLLFSQFADTVNYLNEQLKARGIKAVEGVTGNSDDPTAIAYRFSPVSNDKRNHVTREKELRIVLATDVLSEGQNLQDCSIVVNFDLPWAIIRLIQRAGRVDRIGQQSDTILCYSFLPAEGVERIIRLRSRVSQRLQENAEVVGADEAFFEDQNDAQAVRDLFTEKAGILDGDEDVEVDLASYAYQIWKNAIDRDPDLEKTIPAMPNVVYSTKPWPPLESGSGVPPASSEQAAGTAAPQLQDAEAIAAASEPPLTKGACVLRAPAIAGIVRDALCHFDGQRYHLHAWCVMPNHVHAVVTPWGEHTLSAILHSWKSYTAHLINKRLRTHGEVWERESFDHLIRSADALGRFVNYVENNPVEAGLCTRPDQWEFSSCGAISGAGVPPANSRDAAGTAAPHAAPHAAPLFNPPDKIDCSSMKSRGELPHLRQEGATYFVTFRLRDAVGSRGAGSGAGVPPANSRDAAGTAAPHAAPLGAEGALVYLRTSEGNDALAWVDKRGNSVTESQFTILKTAECAPDTPAIPRHDDHHEMVAKGVKLIVETEKSVGGQLGRPSGARFRAYERLKTYAEEIKGTLFDTRELRHAIEDIYKFPLLQSATDTLNRQLKSGIGNQALAELVMALRADVRLCRVTEDVEGTEPQVICSMGLRGHP